MLRVNLPTKIRADFGGSPDFSSLTDVAIAARGEMDLDLDLRFAVGSLLDFFAEDLGDGLREELPLRDDLDELEEPDDLEPDLLLELPELDLFINNINC